MVTEAQILDWLQAVKDPEIPVLSLVDLGVITGVDLPDADTVHVEMTPTFAGCPAIETMRREVEAALKGHGIANVQVNVSFATAWTSNRISERGLQQLKAFGLAPPARHNLIVDLDILESTPCPYCNSADTELKSPFGPTLCRSLHYCHSCKQAFEGFKPL